MSAPAAAMPCPVCWHSGAFDTAQALRERLIVVSTDEIACPVCQQRVVGLDKLTIHLFSHASLTTTVPDDARPTTRQRQAVQEKRPEEKRPEALPRANAAPVKFVKIYPKLPAVGVALNARPVINSDVTDECSSTTTRPACNICGVQFIDEDILKMHNSIIHDAEDERAEPTQYPCHLCSKHFRMRGSLMVHLRVAHYGFARQRLRSADGGPERRPGDGAGGPSPRADAKQWQCDVCSKHFTTKYFLKKHKRLHTGETPYSCSQCNKTFTFQQSYHKHLLYHNDDKPHACGRCGRAFKELSTLHNHQRIHTGEKPFACETCGKCFRQRVSYLVHRRIHTGAMPYKCTACEKAFRYKVSQRTHKCPAQPPGAEKASRSKRAPDAGERRQQEAPFSPTSQANADLIRTGAQISLEDMESEGFRIIPDNLHESGAFRHGASGRRFDSAASVLDELLDSVAGLDSSVPSPSEILHSLCLSDQH